MSASIQMPIYLEGEHLGARRRHYNTLVKSSAELLLEFKSIEQIPETLPIDKLFKIDLASHYRNVDYILETLQNDDMLYVSRALKCLWLLDQQYADVINPKYLETILFPRMIQPAVNKMKHWLQLNLKVPERCQYFYEYYKNEFTVAIKFLYRCSSECILKEIVHIIDKLKPKHFKILCEVCPQVAPIYFENLSSHRPALENYIQAEQDFFNSLAPILKTDGNLYLDLMEKYFNKFKMKKLSRSATKYIMQNLKNRFSNKRELYATMFLDMKLLAMYLNPEEAKDLTVELAKAEYLQSWFSYQKVEPLLKRLNVTERTRLKKDIFVDKSIKPCIEKWPYPIPTPLELTNPVGEIVFTDKEYNPNMYQYQMEGFPKCARIMKRKLCSGYRADAMCFRRKTPLDLLFDRYRVTSFDRTFYELSKKILTEGTVEGRLNILLVLVSKSGGVVSQVTKLLEWLIERHVNEPINLRAAVVRSLVKRGCVWSLPQDAWNMMLEFGRDLGLDGKPPELLCREGLHAVVIRHLLNNIELEKNLLREFTKEFSTLDEYSLNGVEKLIIGERLANLVVNKQPDHLLKVITTYRLKINKVPGALDSLVKSAKEDRDLLHRLYRAKIGRRELLSLTFPLFQNSATFINALKHDISLLEGGKCFVELAIKERPKHDRFLQLLSIYFSEPNGLAEQHRAMIEDKVSEKLKPWFARPLCLLSNGNQLKSTLLNYDNQDNLEKNQQTLASEIRSNVHKAKPPLDVTNVDWQWIGAKAVANRVLVCKSIDLNANIELLLNWKRTARIGFRLALRTPLATKAFIRLSILRPVVALNVALSSYFKNESFDIEVWNIVKQIIQKLNSKSDTRLMNKLFKINSVPKNIQADYWTTIYHLYNKIDKTKLSPIICRLEKMLPDVDENTVELIIKQFITKQLNKDDFLRETMDNEDRCLYIRIIAKHLLLCKSEALQNERLKDVCDTFFNKLKVLFNSGDGNICEDHNKNESTNTENLRECLSAFLTSLKYNKAFLDQRYVSCLPVFERIIMQLRNILPTEEHLEVYISIHLTMLYYKSIKQSMKQNPEIFENLQQNVEEAVQMVGLIFGTYIGNEIRELVLKYFFSVIEIYKKVLGSYLCTNFEYGDSTSMMIVYILKGLLNVGHTEAYLLVEYILCKKYSFCIPQTQEREIFNALKDCKNQEVSFLLQAHLCSS